VGGVAIRLESSLSDCDSFDEDEDEDEDEDVVGGGVESAVSFVSFGNECDGPFNEVGSEGGEVEIGCTGIGGLVGVGECGMGGGGEVNIIIGGEVDVGGVEGGGRFEVT